MNSHDDAPGGSADAQQLAIPDSDDEDELSKPNRALPQPQTQTKIYEQTVGGVEDDSEEGYTVQVQVPTPARPWEYTKFPEDTTISYVVRELQRPGNELWYRVAFEDGRQEEVSRYGSAAL